MARHIPAPRLLAAVRIPIDALAQRIQPVARAEPGDDLDQRLDGGGGRVLLDEVPEQRDAEGAGVVAEGV
jgi:hypothetical protein